MDHIYCRTKQYGLTVDCRFFYHATWFDPGAIWSDCTFVVGPYATNHSDMPTCWHDWIVGLSSILVGPETHIQLVALVQYWYLVLPGTCSAMHW